MVYIVLSFLLFIGFGYLSLIGFPLRGVSIFAGYVMSAFWGYMALNNLTLAILRVAADFFDMPAGRLFMKPDGGGRFWRMLIRPYLNLEKGAWKRYRKKAYEPLFSKVSENIFIGSHPKKEDWQTLHEMGIAAVLDVNCELFPAPHEKANPALDYLCVPSIDGSAPSLSQIGQAVDWSMERLTMGKKVLVHCTFGHGRSALMVVCLLVRSGVEPDQQKAMQLLKSTSRSIHLTWAQKRAMEKFLKTCLKTCLKT